MSIKLSCLPCSLFSQIISGGLSFLDWADIAADAGLNAFDISSMFIREHTAVYLDKLSHDIAKAPVKPLMMTTYPDFTNPDADERCRQSDLLNFDIAMCDKLGFKYLRVTAGQNHPNINFNDAVGHVLEGFAAAGKTAENYGIQLVFENHAKPGAWPLVDFSFDPKAFLAIAAQLPGTGVGINFDTANARACGADVVDLYLKVAPLVKTLHLNDTRTVGHLDMCMLGEGIVDFKAFSKAIKDTGFDGWMCIEEGSNRGVAGIKAAAKYAREVME